MLNKCILFLTVMTTAYATAIIPQNQCQPACCETQECCQDACISKTTLWATGAAAIAAGAITGALVQKGKKGHKGHRGATGPIPNFERDVGQSIQFDVSLVVEVQGSSPEIVLIPFLTDPVGNTQTLPPIFVNTPGYFDSAVQTFTYNDPYNGIYYWGFMVQAKNANGTVIDIHDPNTDWVATPSRDPEPEFGVLLTSIDPLINSDILLTVQVPAYIVYDKDAF